jgi:hypothetical protein
VPPRVANHRARCAPAGARPTRSSASHRRCALDQDGGRLDAGLFAVVLSSSTSTLKPVRSAQRRIHAQQHQRPVLALGAAGAGMDFEIGVVAVGLARQQASSCGARFASTSIGLQLASPSGIDRLVALGLAISISS